MFILTDWSVLSLESDPSCGYKIQNRSTNEELQMWCTVSFRGNWAPVMEWNELRGSNIPHPVDTKYVENRTEPNNNVTYIVTIPVTSIKLPYACKTKFLASMRPSATIATNVPSYTFDWISSSTLSGDHGTIIYYIQGTMWLSSALSSGTSRHLV